MMIIVMMMMMLMRLKEGGETEYGDQGGIALLILDSGKSYSHALTITNH